MRTHLGQRVGASDLAAGKFDEIVLATGVVPRVPRIPGQEHPKVLTYVDVLLRGKPVGKRVAIVGFDDQTMAAEAIPPLTTVRVPRTEIGRRAAEMLLGRLQGRPVAPRREDLGFRIVARASA